MLIKANEHGCFAQVVADSISLTDARLTTLLIREPLINLVDHTRQRMASYSVESNRAIPTDTLGAAVRADPFVPWHWPKTCKGMSAKEEFTGWRVQMLKGIWDGMRTLSLFGARFLSWLGVYKQLANRLMQPHQYVLVQHTATDDGWLNFFGLRDHPDTEPHLRDVAGLCADAYFASEPIVRGPDDWHLPWVTGAEEAMLSLEEKIAVSAARSARASYAKAGVPRPLEDEIASYQRFVTSTPKHLSVVEHQARPMAGRHGCFEGWRSHRCDLHGEAVAPYVYTRGENTDG